MYSEVYKGFKERLVKLRRFKGISQADLSTNIGYSSGNISSWESGKVFPSTKAVVTMANYYKCDMEWLLTEMGKAPDGWEEWEEGKND